MELFELRLGSSTLQIVIKDRDCETYTYLLGH